MDPVAAPPDGAACAAAHTETASNTIKPKKRFITDSSVQSA
jgi:hypothetical protein